MQSAPEVGSLSSLQKLSAPLWSVLIYNHNILYIYPRRPLSQILIAFTGKKAEKW